jgi:hypothetical protein
MLRLGLDGVLGQLVDLGLHLTAGTGRRFGCATATSALHNSFLQLQQFSLLLGCLQAPHRNGGRRTGTHEQQI